MNIIHNKNLGHKDEKEFGSMVGIGSPKFKGGNIKTMQLQSVIRENKNKLILRFGNGKEQAWIKSINHTGEINLDLLEKKLKKEILNESAISYYDLLHKDYF